MKVLVVEPGYAPYEKEIEGLKEMQAIVDGPIQAIYPYEEKVALVCNEEGILQGLPFNRSVPGGYGGVFGSFFICGLGEEDFISLTPEQIKKYKKEYQKAELLLSVEGQDFITLKTTARKKEKTPPKKRGDGHERG